jgi:preprotein translocase subunit SecG
MKDILPILQIIVAVFLILFILLQQRGAGLGSAFGGGGGEGSYGTRRGIQKKLLWGSVFLGFLFILLSILNLIF